MATARESASPRTQKSVYARVSIRVFAPAITHRERLVNLVRVCMRVYVRVEERTRAVDEVPIDLPTHFLDGYSTCATRLSPSQLEIGALCIRRYIDVPLHPYMKLLMCSLINDEIYSPK